MEKTNSNRPATRDITGKLVILVIVAAVTGLYYWTINPIGAGQAFLKSSNDYYSLLTSGFLKGQLSLDLPADPFLATLANPLDPVQRAGHGLHDASYYNGKYYIYFGVTPVIVLMLPLRVLTGLWMDQAHVSLLFCALGFWVSVLLLYNVRKLWFPKTPWTLLAIATTVLGLATMTPLVLRRPSIWEVPISCSYFFFMLTLWCLFKALTAKRSPVWLAAASLSMGLCIGARPTYLFAASTLLIPVAMAVESGFLRQRRWWTLALCAVVPIAVIGIGLATYNYLRFGNPMEFGQAHQMAGDDVTKCKLFGPEYMLYNLRIYFLEPAGLSPHFPFVTIIDAPKAPPGFMGIENPYGLLPNTPWVLLGCAAPFLLIRSRGVPGLEAVRGLFFCLITALITIIGTVLMFGGACGRYMVDFSPSFILLAACSLFWILNSERRLIRIIATSVGVLLGLWSAAFGICVGMQHNNLFQVTQPASYSRVAHAANHVSSLLGAVRGHQYGPMEMELTFPSPAPSQMEPILVSGVAFRSDYLLVQYIDQNHLRFLFIHTNFEPVMGPVLSFTPGERQKLVIELACLYPPSDHPWWDGYSADQRTALSRRVKMTMNGKIALEGIMQCYDATDFEPQLGSALGYPAFKNTFTGIIHSTRRTPVPDIPDPRTRLGPIEMKFIVPPFTSTASEPLLCSGVTGKGDLVFITYVDGRHIRLGHDHWGEELNQSDLIEIDPAALQTLRFDSSFLRGTGDDPDLVATLNGKVVFSSKARFHQTADKMIFFGENLIGASTSTPHFKGTFVSIERNQP